jgi:serine/threonine-protein kinase
LLRDLCLAADAAHRSLVVHRDLKPANVLVEQGGRIKVLDFGVARLVGGTEPVTATQHISLTPGYAAPEQYASDGAVTTSVDVYALGVIAGEVLIGTRLMPDATIAADSDGQCRHRWSALDPDLKVMLRASTARFAKDRYVSARHLADDIARYLEGEPIIARAASHWYRLHKLVARNRPTAALLLALIVAIAMGLGLATWQAREARTQAHRAVLMQTFLVDVLGAAETTLPPDQTPTPRQVVAAAIKRLATDDSLERSTKADIAITLGSVSHSFGAYEEAEQSAQLALKLRREDPASNTGDILALETNLAEAKFQLSKFDDAAAMLAADHQLMVDTNSSSAVNGLAMASDIEAARGHHSAAAQLEKEAVRKGERVLPAGSRAALVMQIWTGERDPGTRSAYAIAKIGPAISEWRRHGYAEDSDFAHAIGTLAIAKNGVGDLRGAEADFIEAINAYRRIFGGPHSRLAWQLEQYGNMLCTEGRFREAELALKEANQMQRKVLGEDSLPVAASTNYLAVLELNRRNFAGAEEYAKKAVRLCLRIPIDGEPCPDAKATMAQVLMQTGRLDEAEAEIDDAVRARERDFGPTHPAVAALLVHVAKLRLLQRRWEEALTTSDRVLAFESLPHKTRISAESYRAESLYALGRDEESLNEIDDVLGEGQRLSPHLDLRLMPILALKAEILSGLGKPVPSREAARTALALRVAANVVPPEILSTLHRLAAD